MSKIKEINVRERLLKCINIIDKISGILEWLFTNILCIFIAMNFSTDFFNITEATINISKSREISVNTLLYVVLNLIIVYISGKSYNWISKRVEEWYPKTPSQIISSILVNMVTSDINKDELNFMFQKIVNRIFLIIVTSIIILTMMVNVTI